MIMDRNCQERRNVDLVKPNRIFFSHVKIQKMHGPVYFIFTVELKRGLSESDDEEYFESRGSVSRDFIIFDNFGS